MRDRLKVDSMPIKLRIESEPYAVFVGRQFVAAIDVYDVKRKREFYLIISPMSLSQEIKSLIESEPNGIVDSEIWVSKESDDKFAKYCVELA